MALLPAPLISLDEWAPETAAAEPAARPVRTKATRRNTTMRRHHLQSVGMVSALALLLGVWGPAPVLAAREPANGTATGETPESYSPLQIVSAVLKLSDAQA